MQIILFRDYACAPDGHTTIRYKAGDVVTGKAAELALADGAAFEAGEPPKLETKVKRGKK